jgi:hypothetical protein
MGAPLHQAMVFFHLLFFLNNIASLNSERQILLIKKMKSIKAKLC